MVFRLIADAGEDGHKGYSESREFFNNRGYHGDPQNVGLELHEELVARGAPVGMEEHERGGGGFHSFYEISHLISDGFETCSNEVLPAAAPRKSSDKCANPMLPVGSTQPCERRHKIDTTVVREAAQAEDFRFFVGGENT